METLLTPADIERLAAEAGLTLKEVCARARIAQSTFSRWRANKTTPSIEVYQKIIAALRGETNPNPPASPRAVGAAPSRSPITTTQQRT